MGKAIFLLEGLSNSRRSKCLHLIERVVKLFEIIFFIAPTIEMLKRKKDVQLIVLSQDVEILKFLHFFGIYAELISEEFNKNELEDMFKESLEFFEKLFQHLNGNEITFLNVNLLTIIQEDFVDLFFDRIKKIKYATNYIEDQPLMSIYVDNAQSPLAQVFEGVVANKKISYKPILPKFYSKSKNRIQKYLLYTRFRIPHINTIQVLSCNNNNKQGLLSYVPYINFEDAVLPVITKLVENEYYHKVYIVGEKKSIFKKFKCYTEVPTSFKNIKISKELKNIKQIFLSNFIEDSFHEIFQFQGVNFWNSIKDDLYYITQKRIKHIILNLKECDIVLDETCPNLLLVGDERMPRIRTCVLLAKYKKIPVIEIQHGIYSNTRPKIPPVSDKICVWGEYSKKSFINYVDSQDQIIVTGCPKFDQLIKKMEDKTLVNRTERKKILFTTQYGLEDTTTLTIEKIIPFLTIEKNTYLIIKPHPAEKKEQYYKYAKKSPKVVLEEPRANINDLLLEADVLVTISSSVGINAAILDIPIVLINLNNKISPYSSISLEVRDIEEIVPSIKSVLYDKTMLKRMKKARKEFVHEHAYLQDGKSSQRVVDIIMRLTKK